jgi:hypothetical protein
LHFAYVDRECQRGASAAPPSKRRSEC